MVGLDFFKKVDRLIKKCKTGKTGKDQNKC